MRRSKFRVFAVTSFLGVAALWIGPPLWDSVHSRYDSWQFERAKRAQIAIHRELVQRNSVPATPLPERPGDRASYPRETFSTSFRDENGFGIDTSTGTVTYDRIADPDTTVAIRLSTAQLDSLYELALQTRLFDITPPPALPCGWAGCDHWRGTVTVSAGDAGNSFEWNYWSIREPWSDDHKRVDAYVRMLRRMVEQNRVYRALPEPRGIYID